MEFHVLTLFPELIDQAVRYSILGRAIEAGIITVYTHNVRDFTFDRHRTVDDEPYGGGPGMVMKIEPIVLCLEDAIRRFGPGYVVVLSAAGRLFKQEIARELAAKERIYLICGHYEGIDERVVEHFSDLELSIGDYVLTGGEYPALVVIDAVSRLVPGVVGNAESVVEESHSGGLLEYPQYTRPREFRGLKVPEVLVSGNHAAIARFRYEMALKKTKKNRPDLYERLIIGEADEERGD